MIKKMKKFVLPVLMVFLLLFSTSCTQESDLDFLIVDAGEKYNLSYTERQNEDYVAFLNKLETFYAKLSEELYLEYGLKYDNMCISPVSIYMALALTIECSNANTRAELLNAIGVTYEEVKMYTKMLYAQSNQEFTQTNDFGKKEVKALELLTNSIWFEESIQLKEVGLQSLSENYNCSSYAAPFNNNNEVANEALRDFISRNTKGLINRNFNLGKDTLIALVNTLYLKEIWNDIGDELSFSDKNYPFTNYDGQTKELQLLQGYYNFGVAVEEEAYRHFYTKTNHGYSLKFIVPKDGYTVDDIYKKEILEYVNNLTDYQAVDDRAKTISNTRCLFPEFTANFNENIKKVIKDKFNVNDLFDFEECDFSNIVDPKEYLDKYVGIYCSSIIHQTELKVNKKGIEGAAVTIVAMDGADGAIDEYEHVYYDFVIDRDFAYIITDSSGVVLFSGVVKKV